MGKYRMYEPWGFQDENNYISKKSSIDEDLAESKKNDEKELKDIEELKETKVDSASYNSDEKKIVFSANGNEVASIDATDFVKDGMIESVELDGTVLKITFNTEAGKEEISVDLKDVFNTDSYYTKDEVDSLLVEKADKSEIPSLEGYATEAWVEGKGYLTEHQDVSNLATKEEMEASLETKADKQTTYTQEQVDVMLNEKQTEIDKITSDYKKLKEIVGDLGGAVEYSVPADGKLTDMLKKSGIIKLTEDVESNTYAGGIISKNITTLNLNGKTITTTANTTTNPSIMVRGTQQFTIQGSGTLNANGHIAIEANGEDAVITLGGTSFGKPTYITDRAGELIYCYLGTINITNGVFRNNNENKSFLLNCYDANYQNGTAKIIVTGGKFYDFDPGNNASEGDGTSYLADGYHTEASTVTEDGVEHTVYTVKKDA